MKQKTFLLSIALLLLAAMACSTVLPQVQNQNNSIPQTEDQVPRIDVEEAKTAFDSGQAILVDVRSVDSYAAGHAAGAISIPLENFENNINTLSLEKDQWIITYCT